MTADLPKRPEPKPEDQGQIVDPTDRIKSAGDKLDPRFEAARQKAEREEELRARAKKKAGTKKAKGKKETAPPQGDDADADTRAASGGFTFNLPAPDAEEDA
jgi:hypothetical protein